jgi:hypothetical protein
MNPITRMMKRYIKMPLKYALPLLFIGALVLVSISGCTSSSTQYPTSGHSELIQGILDKEHSVGNWKSFDVSWYNDTSAGYTGTTSDSATEQLTTWTYTFQQFPTVDNATAYFETQRVAYPTITKYVIYTPDYYGATHHDPTVFKQVQRDSGLDTWYLTQQDALVSTLSMTHQSLNAA